MVLNTILIPFGCTINQRVMSVLLNKFFISVTFILSVLQKPDPFKSEKRQNILQSTAFLQMAQLTKIIGW